MENYSPCFHSPRIGFSLYSIYTSIFIFNSIFYNNKNKIDLNFIVSY